MCINPIIINLYSIIYTNGDNMSPCLTLNAASNPKEYKFVK